MKSTASALILFAAAFSLTATGTLSAAPQKDQAYTHPVRVVERLGRAPITRGSTAVEVVQSLGQPKRKLSESMWVYRNYDAGFAQLPDDDCTTLLVTFANGKVSDLQLINDRAEIIFAARIEAKTNARLQVAAK